MSKVTRYSKREKEIIHRLKEEGKTPLQISQALASAGYKRSNRAISCYLYDNAQQLPRVEIARNEKYTRVVNQIDDIRMRMHDIARDHFTTVGQTEQDELKVLVLTDLHIPFELDSVINHAIKNHGDADILVIGGDMLDAYSVSAFRKDKPVLFRWELEIALEYIKLFANMFPRVILVSGNHERRVRRYVTDNLGNMLRGLVHDDPMQILADGMGYGDDGKLTKLYNFENVLYDSYPRADYTRIGQLIVAHPNNYSTVPLRTVVNTAESLLDTESHQCIMMGHTHTQGQLVWRNKLLMEVGCCCMPMEYTFSTGRFLKLPQTFGYGVAYLDGEGNVNFNKTQNVYQGIGRLICKDALDTRLLVRERMMR